MTAVLTPAQRMAAYSMSEDELQQNVRELCGTLGLRVQHIHDSRRCWLPGWPDLTIIGSDILFRELKSERGALSPEQRQVGSWLYAAGQGWCVWRPRDWVDGTIRRQLEALTEPVSELCECTCMNCSGCLG